jgi:hypothetical protein
MSLFVIFCTQLNACAVVEQSPAAPGSAKKKAPAKTKAKGKTAAKSVPNVKGEKSAVTSEQKPPGEAAAANASASAKAEEPGGGAGSLIVKQEQEQQQGQAEEVCPFFRLFAALSVSN